MISLAALAVFSGLSLNLLLQFALGATSIAGDPHHKTDNRRELPSAQFLILFLSILSLWLFFNFIMPGFLKGFFEFFLYFPLSALACMGFELLAERLRSWTKPKTKGIKKTFSSLTAYEGLVPAALMIGAAAADSFTSIIVLALFFTIGNIAGLLILNEIRRKSTLEMIPKNLRGSPLIIISMGLLALIFASAAGIFFKILEAFLFK